MVKDGLKKKEEITSIDLSTSFNKRGKPKRERRSISAQMNGRRRFSKD